ncbi:drug/metabolite transporter (DMT)-like permease [Paenibacillus castaneae]|uniref:DMT family transporter n=1 Tax=Paenibacillus castaneae TaxID=474957 RepID=UPI000C9A22F6|nr:DMT family transporter [Paenibacillus castaneae]NIK79227.1 drug/metabolite transporter (DMT)-like permease [Paenibacillus castaneae]
MSYILLLLATLAWSFVGVLVKAASTMVDSAIISFARFFFGVICLGIYLFIRDGKIQLRFGMKWIWLGAIGKAVNYMFENIAIKIGYSYGNILVQPVQTVVLLFAAALLFKEKISTRGWISAAFCVAGVIIVGWNGTPLDELVHGSGLTTLLFTLAGIGAAVHVLSQRKLLETMDNGNMNLSVFLLSTLIVTVPIPVQSHGFIGPITAWAWGALVLLGVITGLSFFWFAEAIKRVPFAVVAIVGNCTVLFTILWSYIFFKDPITIYIISGTLIFVAGLLLLSLPKLRRSVKKSPIYQEK